MKKQRDSYLYWQKRAESAEALLEAIASMDMTIPLGERPTLEFYRARVVRAIKLAEKALQRR